MRSLLCMTTVGVLNPWCCEASCQGVDRNRRLGHLYSISSVPGIQGIGTVLGVAIPHRQVPGTRGV